MLGIKKIDESEIEFVQKKKKNKTLINFGNVDKRKRFWYYSECESETVF